MTRSPLICRIDRCYAHVWALGWCRGHWWCWLKTGDPRLGYHAPRSRSEHGTIGHYANHGCRCEPCTAAHTRYIAQMRARRRAKPIPDHVEHGLESTYSNWHCRCWKCTTANSVAAAIRQDRRRETARAT